MVQYEQKEDRLSGGGRRKGQRVARPDSHVRHAPPATFSPSISGVDRPAGHEGVGALGQALARSQRKGVLVAARLKGPGPHPGGVAWGARRWRETVRRWRRQCDEARKGNALLCAFFWGVCLRLSAETCGSSRE